MNQMLPQNWLTDTTINKKRLMGRTGIFPCIGAAAYLNGILKVVTDPGDRNSALLDLLKREKDISGCILATPIEPQLNEADEIMLWVKKKKIVAICFGALNPSLKHRNKLVSLLQKNGIRIFCLHLDDQVSELDRRYWVWASEGRSYIHLKISLTADGMVVPIPGQRARLAGKESGKRIHRLRGIYDGLLIGGVTVRQDNPQMTYRGGEDLPQPRKIILSRVGKFDQNLTAFKGEPPLICSEENLLVLTKYLAKQNITSILVEGGWQVYKAFIDQQVFDEVSLIWTKGLGNPKSLKLPGRLPYGCYKKIGEDIWEIIQWPANRAGRLSPQNKYV
ncbi:MAG: RibD family protein [Candidatus Kerfeldbacteria bacterium]|nr:RibD family protein [Candidatus Kerfeldbacteria bacterium]